MKPLMQPTATAMTSARTAVQSGGSPSRQVPHVFQHERGLPRVKVPRIQIRVPIDAGEGGQAR